MFIYTNIYIYIYICMHIHIIVCIYVCIFTYRPVKTPHLRMFGLDLIRIDKSRAKRGFTNQAERGFSGRRRL